jgi:hypothetical protein
MDVIIRAIMDGCVCVDKLKKRILKIPEATSERITFTPTFQLPIPITQTLNYLSVTPTYQLQTRSLKL